MLSKSRRISRHLQPKSRPLTTSRGRFCLVSTFKYEGLSRFSFSISKKVSKSAVLRNKLRRFGYRAVSEYLENSKEGFLVRFSVQSIPKDYEEFRDEVKTLLYKVSVLR